MIYRQLGNTGLKVSQLGFGAMRLPTTGEGKTLRVNDELAVPLIHRAFQAGVNYIDSAIFYCNSDSQRAVGEALKGWRDKIIVSTKNSYKGQDESVWWKNLEDSLRLLGVECIDVYNLHGNGGKTHDEFAVPFFSKWAAKARDQGLIKHVCCSFHDNNAVLRKIIDSGLFEAVTVQYNMLDQQLTDAIAYAHCKGVGVVVMGPVAGGRLGTSSDVLDSMIPNIKRLPELALRFVLANPNVSLALSGMSEIAQVDENVATANDPSTLSPADLAIIDEHLVRLKKMADLYCTGCGYCMPCPKDVQIPKIFDRYNRGRVYGLWDAAKAGYDAIGSGEWEKGNRADACSDCGACETKCPQKLPIRKQLKEAHAAMKKD